MGRLGVAAPCRAVAPREPLVTPKRLSAEDRALWDKVKASATPLRVMLVEREVA